MLIARLAAKSVARIAFLGLLILTYTAGAQVTLTQGTNISVDAAEDGRLAIDLLGGIWIVPPPGGSGKAISTGLLPASRPKWAPDSSSIVYQARAGSQEQLWLYDFAAGSAATISDGLFYDQHPDWHPDGERIAFSSDRADSGFDLWEIDLPSQLSWRVTHQPGDETEPVWSADGRDLVYVHRLDNQWSLMLRRRGLPDEALVTSVTRLSSPAWRPDGSLITYLRHGESGLTIDMIILSEPTLIRTLISGEDFFVAPVTWRGRQQMVYAANGVIRERAFNSWTSKTVRFRATVQNKESVPVTPRPPRSLPNIDEPKDRLAIRVGRLFDGLSATYRLDQDIVIEGGQIVAIEDQKDRPGAVILNFSGLTALPGYIDSYADLPQNSGQAIGPLILSYGVTTIIAEHANAAALNKLWSGEDMPGPRLLLAQNIGAEKDDEKLPWLVTIGGDMTAGTQQREKVSAWQSGGVPVLAENWQVGIGSGASLLLGADSIPASPAGQSYSDIRLANGSPAATVVSGLADARTPGLDRLMRSRQAPLLQQYGPGVRRFAVQPQLARSTATVVLGSKPNGLPPGIALHAEFRSLAQAGLKPAQVLRTAGVNASNALGVGLQIGRLVLGGKADLVLVSGDPLANIDDTRKIAGVVRNGRFYSVIGLIERAEKAGDSP
jgi:hypothetical protein